MHLPRTLDAKVRAFFILRTLLIISCVRIQKNNADHESGNVKPKTAQTIPNFFSAKKHTQNLLCRTILKQGKELIQKHSFYYNLANSATASLVVLGVSAQLDTTSSSFLASLKLAGFRNEAVFWMSS